MYFEEIGSRVRAARQAHGLTQAELADITDLSRTTINQLESGATPDIGVRRLLAIFEALKLDMSVTEQTQRRKNEQDYIALACTSANVSYKGKLDKTELVHALVTGKIPPDKRPQLRVVFDELPPPIFEGLLHQIGAWCTKKKLLKNVSLMAEKLHSVRRISV